VSQEVGCVCSVGDKTLSRQVSGEEEEEEHEPETLLDRNDVEE
jgi:hypothetical protein